ICLFGLIWIEPTGPAASDLSAYLKPLFCPGLPMTAQLPAGNGSVPVSNSAAALLMRSVLTVSAFVGSSGEPSFGAVMLGSAGWTDAFRLVGSALSFKPIFWPDSSSSMVLPGSVLVVDVVEVEVVVVVGIGLWVGVAGAREKSSQLLPLVAMRWRLIIMPLPGVS